MKKLILCVAGAVLVSLFAVSEANAANLNFGTAGVIGVIKDKVLDGPKGQMFGNVKTDDLTDMAGKNKKKDNGPLIVLSVAFLIAAGAGVFYYMRKKAEKSEDDIDVDDLPDVDLDDDDDKF
ncbi:MAG: hypothetical protein FWB85_11375 [Chitinispirillia bacterium]|nr:hypothetical protein [Chitinispirillia bacterium]